jgi:VTC domain
MVAVEEDQCVPITTPVLAAVEKCNDDDRSSNIPFDVRTTPAESSSSSSSTMINTTNAGVIPSHKVVLPAQRRQRRVEQQQQQQRQAQKLLEKILLLIEHQLMDEHVLGKITKEAETLVTESLETLHRGDGSSRPDHSTGGGTNVNACWTRPGEEPFTNTTAVFSDIFASLQKAALSHHTMGTNNAAAAGPDLCWVAPISFERQTNKYWVEETKLAAVLLLASTEAPLLVYGRPSGLISSDLLLNKKNEEPPTATAASSLSLWDQVAVKVSSVYFDSPTRHLYHARIEREEGSRLLRARWYGNQMPIGDEPIYLELKTHHEAWVMDRSVKERVVIQEKYMPYFLSFVPWTEDVVRQIVSSANPDQEEYQREKGVHLLLTMQEIIIQWNLRPCVRSVYERVSFQSADSNALRMTIDRNVTLFDESQNGGGSTGSTSLSSSSWCVPDGSAGSGLVFPYSIFEIKVTASSDKEPHGDDFGQRWAESGLIIDAAKFSKYQTGVVAYNQEKIGILPYWTTHPSFAKFLSSPEVVASGRGDDGASCYTQSASFGTPTASLSGVHPVVHDKTSPTLPAHRPPIRRRLCPPTPYTTRTKSAIFHGQTTAPRRPVRIEPKTYFANERTCKSTCSLFSRRWTVVFFVVVIFPI